MDQKYVESFEMWCWRRVEKITWSDGVRSDEVLHSIKDDRNILHTTRQCTYNVTLRRVRVTIVAVENQRVLRILIVCL